jgi:hypothetical protein
MQDAMLFMVNLAWNQKEIEKNPIRLSRSV